MTLSSSHLLCAMPPVESGARSSSKRGQAIPGCSNAFWGPHVRRSQTDLQSSEAASTRAATLIPQPSGLTATGALHPCDGRGTGRSSEGDEY
jgi:hypothetical protein